jgi:hypothetical protein
MTEIIIILLILSFFTGVSGLCALGTIILNSRIINKKIDWQALEIRILVIVGFIPVLGAICVPLMLFFVLINALDKKYINN